MVTLSSASRPVRSAFRTGVFMLKVLPMLPSRPLDLVTPTPVVEKLTYPTQTGEATGDLYRPASPGRHPAVVVCLGVVPFGVDHPQVPILGRALARAGFAALLYWSPAMRDFRLDPEDVSNIALAYDRLLEQPYVDAEHSGLIGTCVGASFALMASASPLVRDRVSFIGAFAPYASLFSLGRDIASGSCLRGAERTAWKVDQLTRRVFAHSLTSRLDPAEAQTLIDAYEAGSITASTNGLSSDARAVAALLDAQDLGQAKRALEGLPEVIRDGLRDASPLTYLGNIHAPLIAISHDRDDAVIPVSESRALSAALAGRDGLHYTEFAMFEHADPTKRKLSPLRLTIQLTKFYLWLNTVFRQA